MSGKQKQIRELQERLEFVLQRQQYLHQEISQLKTMMAELSAEASPDEVAPPTGQTNYVSPPAAASVHVPAPATSVVVPKNNTGGWFEGVPDIRSNLEKYIGEHLVNLIGIAITIIGVGIGAKYAIDHELVSPTMRIIAGYLVGLILLGFAIKLHAGYKRFSAVLLSGSMAIMYFITYAAFSFYRLFPASVAFPLMVIFTVVMVLASLKFNMETISIIGLVGAYAVPVLLGENSGNANALFAYMCIINTGILALAFYRYWKVLYLSAFGLSWIVYCAWYFLNYDESRYFTEGIVYVSAFYLLFYLTILAYKLVKKEVFAKLDVILLLLNSLLFFSIGYAVVDSRYAEAHGPGIFTLVVAASHALVAFVVSRVKLADRNLFYMTVGLSLVFLTIAIPVELDGNWVTLLWTGEAVVLFFIGRAKVVPVYEKMSYPLMAMALLSMMLDWAERIDLLTANLSGTAVMPVFNIHFLTTLLFAMGFGAIFYWQRHSAPAPASQPPGFSAHLLEWGTAAALLLATYMLGYMEIEAGFTKAYWNSGIKLTDGDGGGGQMIYNVNLKLMQQVWNINYSMLYVAVLAVVNGKWVRSTNFRGVTLALASLFLLFFLFVECQALSTLREFYLHPSRNKHFEAGIFNLLVRYLGLLCAGCMLFSLYWMVKQLGDINWFRKSFTIALHFSIVVFGSWELVHWLHIADVPSFANIGISIFWGFYALFMIVLGIQHHQKWLRLSAIVWFAITLVKLFFLDLEDMETIPKTITFITLGALLLLISFLYTKYRNVIEEKPVTNESA